MHDESSHEGQRGTCNHGGEPVATAAANQDTIDGSSSAAPRSPPRARAFAALLAEATMRSVDALRGTHDEIGLITPVMP